MLRALAFERLNSTEDALPKPWISALSGALSTAIGAFIPVIFGRETVGQLETFTEVLEPA